MKKLLLTLLFLLSVVIGNAQTPYAIWTEENSTMTFLVSTDKYEPGDTYNGQIITNVWYGSLNNSGSLVQVSVSTVTDKLTKVVFAKNFAQAEFTSTAYWFLNCKKLSSIEGLKYLNTTKVTDMHGMFYNCSNLMSLDLSGWDTSNVTNMCTLFFCCSSLTSVDVSGWDTSNVTGMTSMFIRCTSLTSLDVSGWDTSNVTDMH